MEQRTTVKQKGEGEVGLIWKEIWVFENITDVRLYGHKMCTSQMFLK